MDRELIVPERRSSLRRVSGVTVVLAITGTLGRLITLITQTLIAREFGLSRLADAYFAIEKVPELLISFVAAGFSASFIPMFAEYRINQGEDEAWRFASSFLFISLITSLLFTLVTAVGASPVVGVIAPGFEGTTRDIAVRLLRIMALSIALLGLNAGLLGLLQSHGEFFIPEFGRIAYNVVLLGAAWTLSRGASVSVLAWGIVLGAIVWLVIQIAGVIRGELARLVWIIDHPGTRRAVQQFLPFVIAVSGVEVTLMIDRVVASALSEGSIAALNYASRIILLPVGLLALPLRTAFYPSLSELAVQSRLRRLAETTVLGLRMLLFIVLPAAVGLTALRVPIIRLLFERGAFDGSATYQTSQSLIAYSVAVPAISATFFLIAVYLSLGEVVTLVSLHAVTWVVNLVLSLLLSRPWGHTGVAVGTAISANVAVILSVLVLKQRRLASFALSPLLLSISRSLLISTVMGALLFLLPTQVSNLLGLLHVESQALRVAILVLLGATTYLSMASLLRADELTTLVGTLRGLAKARDS